MSDTTLPTATRAPSYDISRLRIFLHGPPKSGKSTWAASWPNALFLSTERGLEYLNVAEKSINDWDHLIDVIDVLAAGGHGFKTIIIDTMDIAASMARDAVCKKYGEEFEGDGNLGWGKGTTMIAASIERMLRKLAALPYGVILISHTEHKAIKKKAGLEIKKAQPTLHEKVNRLILGWVDMVLYMDQDEVIGSDGKLHEIRVFRTAASAYWEAGDRTHCLPATLPVPMSGGYDAFVAALKGDKSTTTNTKEKE